jgi:hypothetical protein
LVENIAYNSRRWKDDIKMALMEDDYETGRWMDDSGSGSCKMVGFSISGGEPLGFTT